MRTRRSHGEVTAEHTFNAYQIIRSTNSANLVPLVLVGRRGHVHEAGVGVVDLRVALASICHRERDCVM